MEKILILGAGGWGTALAMVLRQGEHDVRVWGRDPEYMAHLENRRENPKFLPGVTIPGGIRFGSDVKALSQGVLTIVSVVPTQFLRSTIESLSRDIPKPEFVVSCSKGLEMDTLRRPSEIVGEIWPQARRVVLSGPSHAEEVSRGLPTAVVAAADDTGAARHTQSLFSGDRRFRTYTGSDPVGVELGGVSKNIVAIAAGIADGLGFGDNTRAGLMTRGLREMTRLGARLGAQEETFAGLSGVGDLIATCTSEHSRNRTVGFRVGSGERLEDILRSTEKIAEGVPTTQAFRRLGEQLGVHLPITVEVHAVLFEGKPPREAVESLLARESGEEIG